MVLFHHIYSFLCVFVIYFEAYSLDASKKVLETIFEFKYFDRFTFLNSFFMRIFCEMRDNCAKINVHLIKHTNTPFDNRN